MLWRKRRGVWNSIIGLIFSGRQRRLLWVYALSYYLENKNEVVKIWEGRGVFQQKSHYIQRHWGRMYVTHGKGPRNLGLNFNLHSNASCCPCTSRVKVLQFINQASKSCLPVPIHMNVPMDSHWKQTMEKCPNTQCIFTGKYTFTQACLCSRV